MAIEHDAIADGERHEPKGIASATNKQIYVADGAASGAWTDTLLNVHGDMVIEASSSTTAVTAAADATLATDTDYVKITADWASGHVDGITFNVDELVVPSNGDYVISFWATIKVPTINNFIGIKYAVNDTTPYSTRKIIGQSQTANDYLNLSATGIVSSLNASDTISVYVAGTKTDNLIVQEAGLLAYIIHPGV